MTGIRDILKTYWGYDRFRPLQEDIIQSVIAGKDTLALLPTGGGKSICFQVPGMYLSGLCLVISPLIALMKDQVENLKRRGIKAAALYSGMTHSEMDALLDHCIYGDMKFLYVSPERLQTPMFTERLKKMKINLLAIDESHCVSQWGYDFRPPYLAIKDIRQYIPDAPVLALTATATPEVVADIQEKLGFSRPNVYRKSFSRPNLIYVALNEEDKLKKLSELMKAAQGSAVVYVRNRKRTKLISEYLKEQGFSAEYYHAGLDMETRSHRQEAWIKNQYRVIVATNAFGMGIDKPDVRLVVHIDLPDSLEAYFQEAGRAGRDEQKAYAFALYNKSDVSDLEQSVEDAYPPIETIRRVYECISNYLELAEGSGENQTFTLDLGTLFHRFRLTSRVFFNSIKFLERSGYMNFSETDSSFAKVFFHKDDIDERSLNETETHLIKTVLRTHEGVYDQFVRIDEKLLAQKMETEEDKILQLFSRLQQKDVLAYSPKKTGFTVTYLQPRTPLPLLRFPKETYRIRKETSQQKLHAVIQYVTRNDKCRSRLLLEYFGEKDGKNCGQCDVCRHSLHNQEADMDFDHLLQALHTVQEDQLSLTELQQHIPAISKHSHALLRWCIDNELLFVSPDKTVTINRKKLQKMI